MTAASSSDANATLPKGTSDERESLLGWLDYLRGAVIRKTEGLTDDESRWTPTAGLLSLLGIVNHLAHVEWRWIDGAMRGQQVHRHEEEFCPGTELTLEVAVNAYRVRAKSTDDFVRSAISLDVPCGSGDDTDQDLRWVLLHLINETARHAGHADSTRQLLDGMTGE